MFKVTDDIHSRKLRGILLSYYPAVSVYLSFPSFSFLYMCLKLVCSYLRTEQLRIGLTDDNFSMLHLNSMKNGRKTVKEISHMKNVLNGSAYNVKIIRKVGNTRELVVFRAKISPRFSNI